MDEKVKIMEAEEEEQIQSAMYQYFSECGNIPEGIVLRYGDLDSNSIGFFARQRSGSYLKQYVSGTFIAQFPFFLRYRSHQTNSDGRIGAEELLERIAVWMCDRSNYPKLNGNRTVERISSGNAYPVGRNEDGSVDVQINMTLNYMKKGR